MWRAPEGLVSRLASRVVGRGGVGLAAAWPVTTKTGRRDLERSSHHAAEIADTHIRNSVGAWTVSVMLTRSFLRSVEVRHI